MTPGASRWCVSIAGQRACAVPLVIVPLLFGTDATTRSRIASAIGAGRASRFDNLTGTVLAGHHQPLRVWVPCLYFMGLNLSNRQIAGELGLAVSDVQAMTEQLRAGLVAKVPAVELKGEVEIDEVYVVAGHKGQPEEVAKRGGSGAAASWQARRAAAGWKRTNHRSLA